MNYNRYLDLHLCVSGHMSTVKQKQEAKVAKGKQTQAKMNRKFFTQNGVEYFYEFRGDMVDQTRYRSGKSEGFTFDPDAMFAKGNSRNFEDVEITTADVSMLRLHNGDISDGLKQVRYIGCMVAIEQLQNANTLYANLEGLVHWITDKTTTNKLRINCHGSGTSTGGFKMGETVLTAGELVNALALHGLSREAKYQQNLSGLAHNARWKLDSEVTKCEFMGCTYKFEKSWYGSSNKHHCRRCGGIFCDKHTEKRTDLRVALTGPNNLTAKNVRQARVCDKCFAEARDQDGIRDAAGDELRYGLQTIALGLCMGARADDRFSPELIDGVAGSLEAGSLAARLRDELRHRGFHGIKITASNEVVGNSEKTGLHSQFGVTYPHTFMVQNRAVDRVKAGGLRSQDEFDFPAYIWGSQESLRKQYDQLPNPKPEPGIIVQPGSKTVYFGSVSLNSSPPPTVRPRVPAVASRAAAPPAAMRTLLTFYLKWEFTSWHVDYFHEYSKSGVGVPDTACIRLTAPPRVSAIENHPNPPTAGPPFNNVIRVTGRRNDIFKEVKAYGVS